MRKGHSAIELEHKMWRLYEEHGAQFPAEHSFGHLYPATPELISHYRGLDPSNSFNPGIGQTTKRARWQNHPVSETDA